MTEKEKSGSGGKTRREFLKDAGLLVGGTAIGSTVLLAACGGDGETVTKTVTNATTITQGGGATVTLPGATVTSTVAETKFVDPIDGMEFDTLADLKAHFDSAHGATGAISGVVTLNVNGTDNIVQVEPEWPLSFVIREKLGLMATKVGCDRGECGSCTVHIDGRPILACCMLAIECQGLQITTLEGLSDGATLSPVQQLFLNDCVFQCGYCTPGQIMSAALLFDKNPNPTRAEIKLAMSGNLCFCMDYTRIIDTMAKGV
ncbi:(2Fe-2S)-binding protein [Chloroflexota bacterium]